jgi:hypothetical protein
MGTANMIALIASGKDDCLAKLTQEFHFSPDKLPVGLGGSWTGGCEPWRRSKQQAKECTLSSSTIASFAGPGSSGCGNDDTDELTLELETDLTCLFRNSLWLHNQVVSAQQQQQQEHQSLSASVAAAPSSSPSLLTVPAPSHSTSATTTAAVKNSNFTQDDETMRMANTTAVPSIDRKMPAAMTTKSTNPHILATDACVSSWQNGVPAASVIRDDDHPVVAAGHKQQSAAAAFAMATAAAPSCQDYDDDDDDDDDYSHSEDDSDDNPMHISADQTKKHEATEKQPQRTTRDEEKARRRELHTMNG